MTKHFIHVTDANSDNGQKLRVNVDYIAVYGMLDGENMIIMAAMPDGTPLLSVVEAPADIDRLIWYSKAAAEGDEE